MPDSAPVGPLASKIGVKIISVFADEACATMPIDTNTQPYGLLHGGASAALAETVGSLAANAHAAALAAADAAGTGRHAVGVELNISHHRAVREGSVTARAQALHLGSRVASYDVRIVDEADRLVATARLTCMIVTAG